ncbi:interleukin-15 receptor subunit alpha isoform X8 [Megalobrama amblycephala]|uniref:interleukin-15 receptor subunit alpha isoform X8 n=1 Tax=Megalobrama amblycephala TaxID=75352 RepID=UPI0020140D20|nr:interleukin-15 receptor subunit alpha isoform X8 [Megalobrama amblycephala]
MLVLLILIFMTAANQHNFARASGFCGPPQIAYTVPVHETYPINKIIRLQCVEGYVRKAGTSNQIRCTEKDGEKFWEYILNFECIPDPRKPNVPKTDPTTPHVTKKVKGFSHDGVNVSVKTTNVSEETKMEATFSNYTSTTSRKK